MNPVELKETLVKGFQVKKQFLIVSPPGCGKTDIVTQAVTEIGANLIVMHPVVSDPTDAKGLPFVVDSINGRKKEKVAEFLPFGEMREMMKAKSLTICFLDDLGQARPAVQAAFMQLILSKRINGHKLSDNVVFCAATNRKEDKAGVQGILEPVKSRFDAILHLEPTIECWCPWAIDNDMPYDLIAFLRLRPHLLHDFKPSMDMVNSPNPRTVANVGGLQRDMGADSPLFFELTKGAAGETFAAEYVGFLQIKKKLPNPDLVLMDPENAALPVNDTGAIDAATCYALCGALTYKATETNFDRLVKYANRLPAEFSVLLITDCFRKDPELKNTKAAIEWIVKNQDAIN